MSRRSSMAKDSSLRRSAEYNPTGILTSPKTIAPFHSTRAMQTPRVQASDTARLARAFPGFQVDLLVRRVFRITSWAGHTIVADQYHTRQEQRAAVVASSEHRFRIALESIRHAAAVPACRAIHWTEPTQWHVDPARSTDADLP